MSHMKCNTGLFTFVLLMKNQFSLIFDAISHNVIGIIEPNAENMKKHLLTPFKEFITHGYKK